MPDFFSDKRGFVDHLREDWLEKREKSFIFRYLETDKRLEAGELAYSADLQRFVQVFLSDDENCGLGSRPEPGDDFPEFVICKENRKTGEFKCVLKDKYVFLLACRFASEQGMLAKEDYLDVFRQLRKRNGHLAKRYEGAEISDDDVDKLLKAVLNGLISDYFRNEDASRDQERVRNYIDSVNMLLQYQRYEGSSSAASANISLYGSPADSLEYRTNCRKLFDVLRDRKNVVDEAYDVFVPLLINEKTNVCLLLIGRERLRSLGKKYRQYDKQQCYPCVLTLNDLDFRDDGCIWYCMEPRVFDSADEKRDVFGDAWRYFRMNCESAGAYQTLILENPQLRRNQVPEVFHRYFDLELTEDDPGAENDLMDIASRKEEQARADYEREKAIQDKQGYKTRRENRE